MRFLFNSLSTKLSTFLTFQSLQRMKHTRETSKTYATELRLSFTLPIDIDFIESYIVLHWAYHYDCTVIRSCEMAHLQFFQTRPQGQKIFRVTHTGRTAGAFSAITRHTKMKLSSDDQRGTNFHFFHATD